MSRHIGHGFTGVRAALEPLIANPMQLDCDRSRFSRSPPSYTSRERHNSTLTEGSVDPTEQQRRHEELEKQLMQERGASRPNNQFDEEVNAEEKRTFEKIANRTLVLPEGTNPWMYASKVVKQNWVEQGIWRDEWAREPEPHARWLHEQSPEPSPASKPKSDTHSMPNLFGSCHEASCSSPAPKAPVKNKAPQTAKHPDIQKRKDASRPFARFIHQISEERKRIQPEQADGASSESQDINTRAYENVQQNWMKRGIWDNEWGILPGMSWKHERPLQLPEFVPIPVPTEPNHHGAYTSGYAPPLFGNPRPSVEDPPSQPMGQAGLFGQHVPESSPHLSLENPPCQPTEQGQASDSFKRQGRKRKASKASRSGTRSPQRESNPQPENGRRRSERLRARAPDSDPVTSTDSPRATRASREQARATPARDKAKGRGGPRAKRRK